MIALACLILGLGCLVLIFKQRENRLPTDKDVNDLTNKLNRIALDRANRKDLK